MTSDDIHFIPQPEITLGRLEIERRLLAARIAQAVMDFIEKTGCDVRAIDIGFEIREGNELSLKVNPSVRASSSGAFHFPLGEPIDLHPSTDT